MTDVSEMEEEIARELVRVHETSYGETATNLEVAINRRFVAVVMDIELTRAERTLVEAGDEEAVKAAREAFQDAIAPTYTAIVERATGRRVISFASRTVFNGATPWSTEIFRLGDRPR